MPRSQAHAGPACGSSGRRASDVASTLPPRWSVAIRSIARPSDAVMAAVAGKHTEPQASAYIDYRAYRETGGYDCLLSCVRGERQVEDVVKTMEDSSLRGLGGAGFPVGRKWKIVRAEPAPRLMAVNIDEGEPGTFKDRYYLERDPHRFLEGMLIAAWAVGIDDVYVYLRDEYAGVPRDPRAGRSPRSRPIRRVSCRAFTCAAAPAPTSAAKSRR